MRETTRRVMMTCERVAFRSNVAKPDPVLVPTALIQAKIQWGGEDQNHWQHVHGCYRTLRYSGTGEQPGTPDPGTHGGGEYRSVWKCVGELIGVTRLLILTPCLVFACLNLTFVSSAKFILIINLMFC